LGKQIDGTSMTARELDVVLYDTNTLHTKNQPVTVEEVLLQAVSLLPKFTQKVKAKVSYDKQGFAKVRSSVNIPAPLHSISGASIVRRLHV
jgi:hypothetical protein